MGDDGNEREYSVPRGVHINVQEGERVHAGDPLMDGPRNPHDILKVLGEKELQKYLVNEVQEVYRLQGVNINDKHLEVICRQMMRWVRITDIGDTEFLPEEVVNRFKFRDENDRVSETGNRPAKGEPVLLGITKASLSTDSFISAASFQEHPRLCRQARGPQVRRTDRGTSTGMAREPRATVLAHAECRLGQASMGGVSRARTAGRLVFS